jgi:hypothetical protein
MKNQQFEDFRHGKVKNAAKLLSQHSSAIAKRDYLGEARALKRMAKWTRRVKNLNKKATVAGKRTL